MSSSQCARLLEEKREKSQYEERWRKYTEILVDAKNDAQAMTSGLQTKLNEYEQMIEKLVSLKQEVEQERDLYQMKLEHVDDLISIGATFVSDTEKVAAFVSQDMSQPSLDFAKKIFDSNVARWDFLENQQKELHKSLKTLEAADQLLVPEESLKSLQPEDVETDAASSSYFQMFKRYTGQVPQQTTTDVSSSRSHYP